MATHYTLGDLPELVRVDPHRCIAAAVSISSDLPPVQFDCFCTVRFHREADYLQHCQDWLATRLHNLYSSHISLSTANQISRRFTTDFLRPATLSHRCNSNTRFLPVLGIQLRSSSAPDSDVILESFEEARTQTNTQRASINAVIALMIEQGSDATSTSFDHLDDCAICIDKIDHTNWLKLPCTHIFHKTCLLRWFSTNHVCPMCRFKMPTHH